MKRTDKVKEIASSDETWGLIDLITSYGAVVFAALAIVILVLKFLEGLVQ